MGIHVGSRAGRRWPIIDSSHRAMKGREIVAWAHDEDEAHRVAYNMRRSDEWNGKSRFREDDK